jgi:hypothetical protein
MFGFNSTLKQNASAAALVARKPAHCFGYWVELNTQTSGLNIEQDPMQVASFNRGSGN